MYIAVEGCAHGELEKIYEVISLAEERNNIKVDLLICCGDFQSTRNLDDLESMAIPRKYHDMCSFYKYYSGEKIAPMLTIFVGGNHEASNYLQELSYGGWVAPNIYYLGYASVVNVNGIRIAGVSGIYKHHDYMRGHYEVPPYDESTKRSVYHTRELEVFRLKQLSGNIDIFISHDWPRGIYNFADSKQLIRFKPHFKEEIINNKLGSPSSEQLLNILQPSFWFAAHMHCKFAAFVPHENTGKITKFLALDKCLPKRRFLQVLEIEDKSKEEKLKFEYDLEWLTILYLTNHLLNVKQSVGDMPDENDEGRYNFTPTEKEKEIILKKFSNNLEIPKNFVKTAESYDCNNTKIIGSPPKSNINPQTTQFCNKLCIDDPLILAMIENGDERNSKQSSSTFNQTGNDSCYVLDNSNQYSVDSACENSSHLKRKSLMNLPEPKNEEVINFSSDSDDTIDDKIISESKEDENEGLLDTSMDISTTSINLEIKDVKAESNPPIKKFKRRNQDIYLTSNQD